MSVGERFLILHRREAGAMRKAEKTVLLIAYMLAVALAVLVLVIIP